MRNPTTTNVAIAMIHPGNVTQSSSVVRWSSQSETAGIGFATGSSQCCRTGQKNM